MPSDTLMLTETSEQLAAAIVAATGLPAAPYHTGGGVYVLEVALDGSDGADGFHTRASWALWLTRNDDQFPGWCWSVQNYGKQDSDPDWHAEDEPTGLLWSLTRGSENEPTAVATAVATLIDRLSLRPNVLGWKDEGDCGPLFVGTLDSRAPMDVAISTKVGSPDGALGPGEPLWTTRRQAEALASALGYVFREV